MITVNLWDATFGHATCSVLGQTPERIAYVRGREEWDGVTLFVDGHAAPETVRRVKSARKVGWLHEPPCLHPEVYERVDWDGLDLVLTYHAPFLAHPKARFVPYGGIWLGRADWGVWPKKRDVSLLCGTKTATAGHVMRQEAARLCEGHADLYGPRFVVVGYGAQAKRTTLLDYRFSIITEACYADNLFTEWTCDALAVGTIPVLWGCPNIGQFFDPQGVILWETLEELEAILPTLTAEEYRRRLRAVWNNADCVERYAITDDLVAEALDD